MAIADSESTARARTVHGLVTASAMLYPAPVGGTDTGCPRSSIVCCPKACNEGHSGWSQTKLEYAGPHRESLILSFSK